MRVCIFGSDRYLEKLMPLFAHSYHRFWPDNPWPTVVISQTWVAGEFPTICLGPDESFSQQVLRFLDEQGDELFLMLLDDYFLCQPVDTKMLVKCYETMLVDESIMHINVKIIGEDVPAWRYNDFLGEFDKARSKWLIQNQAGIWRPKVLRDVLKPEENGWAMEIRGSQRAKGYPGRFLTLDRSAIEYVNYMERQGPRKEGLTWLKKQGIDPIYP